MQERQKAFRQLTTKTNQLNLNWAKLNETIRKNNRDFAFKKDKFSWEQKQAEKDITEFRFRCIIVTGKQIGRAHV